LYLSFLALLFSLLEVCNFNWEAILNESATNPGIVIKLNKIEGADLAG